MENQLQYAFQAEYTSVLSVVKMSFLWSLQKLDSPNKRIRYSLWIIQGVNLVYLIVSSCIAIVPCIPLQKAWNPELPGHCIRGDKWILGIVIPVLITDALILVMPSWIIWDLQMPLRRKITSISFLSLGIVVIAVGIARLRYYYNAEVYGLKLYSVEIAYSAIECSIGIVGACGPTMKYILGFCVPSLRQAASSKRSAYSTSGLAHHSSAVRSRKPVDGYDNLDAFNGTGEQYEMKSDWKFRKQDADAQSDEQEITQHVGNAHGEIVKCVEWSVMSSGEENSIREHKSHPDVKTEPVHVV